MALFVLMAACLMASGAEGAVVAFLPTGQGDAIVLMDAEGRSVLVDGGGSASREVGRRIIRPALARMGARLDVVIVSHPDVDHVGGLASVVLDLAPQEVWIAPAHRAAPSLVPLLEAAHGVGAVVRAPPASARVGQIELRRVAQGSGGASNDGSVVYEATVEEMRIYLPGDIEELGEERALGRTRPVHVLKVAHHGSRTSSSTPSLRVLSPQIGVVSAGRRNHYGHPHPYALRRLREENVEVYATADCGHIEIRVRGAGRRSRRVAGWRVGTE